MSDMPRITAAVERVFDERLQALRQRHLVELVAKDRFYELQLEAKDREIRGWIDIVEQAGNVTQNTTNKYHVEQYINVFCKESIENISPHAIQELIDNPDNTVYQFVRLKHREGILTDPERAVRRDRSGAQIDAAARRLMSRAAANFCSHKCTREGGSSPPDGRKRE